MAVYKNDANLKALYLLNNDWLDYTPNNNDLTPTNSPTFSVDAQEGSHSADFERSSSQYASIADGDQTGLDITGSISYGGWFKGESGSTNQRLIAKYLTTGNQRAYMLHFNTSGFAVATLSSNGTATATATSGTGLSTGVWYHLCVVYNGTDIRIYLDGSLDSSGTNPLSYSGGIFNSSASFHIGTWGSLTDHYDGLADELFVFDRELTSTEVDDIFNNGIQDPAPAAGYLVVSDGDYSPIFGGLVVR